MTLDFPTSPTIGLTTSISDKVWEYNGKGWKLLQMKFKEFLVYKDLKEFKEFKVQQVLKDQQDLKDLKDFREFKVSQVPKELKDLGAEYLTHLVLQLPQDLVERELFVIIIQPSEVSLRFTLMTQIQTQ